ncbi:hemicentin-1-like isoform X2 [Halichondria panicea]|uniref:hemicentin-1-like isoform X2 n=1 Tax=Halichondria panicea TaxID=6063 RepID=UPI00312BB95A
MSRSLWLLLSLCGLTAAEYVCYRDDTCSVEDPRPVFSLADSLEQCCSMPNIAGGRPHELTNCTSCGPVLARAVGPVNVILTPPHTLVLEVEARAFAAITWLINGTAMHAFPRLSLEMFSKRLLLVNTTSEDGGVYEADVYPIGGGPPLVVQFTVLLPPTPTVTAWPPIIELNTYQPDTTITFMCEGTQMLTWTNSLIPGLLNDYCESDPVDGEAPLETTTLQPSTTDMLGEAPLFTQSPPSSGRRRRRNFNTLPSTHCSVFSSEPVNGTLLSMLVINGELLEQSLYFTCHGNESGSSSVQLLVTNEPYFTTRPRSLCPIVSQDLVLVCGARADSPPTLLWLRRVGNETTPISPSLRLNVTMDTVSTTATESTLRVEGVATTDGGEYICQVSSNGSTSETATLVTVRVPANISEGPVDTEFPVGSVAWLVCYATGVPLPLLTWSLVKENGSQQLLDDLSLTNKYTITTIQDTEGNVASSNLTFPHFQPSDIGRYACNAMNGVTLPQGYTQYQQAYLDLQPVECSADEVLCSSRVECVLFTLTCDLTADCSDGSDEDCTTFAASIIRAPEDTMVTAYSNTSLNCQSFGEGTNITWSFNGRPLVLNEMTLIQESYDPDTSITSSYLTLISPSLEEAGVYHCTVSNGVPITSPRTLHTANASLLILPIAPSIEIRPATEAPVVERDTLYLECHARASPSPLISWLRNGRPLTLSTSLDYKVRIWYTTLTSGRALSVLTVQQLVPGNDDGNYTCRLDNTVDPATNISLTASVSVSISINDNCPAMFCLNDGTCLDLVNGFVCLCVPAFEGTDCSIPVEDVVSPEIVQSPRGSRVEILSSVDLFCDAEGSPQPTFSWQQDGVSVGGTGPLGVLRLTEVRPEDRGFYTCTAHNIHGTSRESAAGLITIRGVYQYLMNVSDCSTDSLDDTIALMTISLVGKALTLINNATLYSVTARPLLIGPPPSNQVLVTIVTGSNYEPIGRTTADLQTALLHELSSITISHACNFTHIIRYDGCPVDRYSFSSTGVLWAESDINPTPIVQQCPCGTLNTTIEEERMLSRVCGGTFRLGGEWAEVEDICGYSHITHGLCDITNFQVVEQFSKVETATQEIALFDAFDLSIASVILTLLASSSQAINSRAHQESFAQTYSNILLANKDEITKSQQIFKSTSELLESLEVFVLGLAVENGSMTSLNTELVQIQVEAVGGSGGGSYTPQLNISDILVGGNITLPPALLSEGLRVANLVLLRDTLFVYDEASLNELTLGNLFISAALLERVEDLSQPVIIEFYQSEMPGNETTNATCLFWDLTAKDGAGDWSSDGCRLVDIQEERVTCECNHLTHFGVLLAISPVTVPNLPLEIISYIGIGLSLVCIAVILITYLCSRKLRKNVTGKLVMNMCIPLGLFYVWFLVAIHGRYYTSFEWFCFVTSSLVQYFLLVYLSWTTVEALHIYLQLVKVFGSDIPHYMLKSALFAWGVPAIITALCTALGIHYSLWAIYDENTLFICYPSSWPLCYSVHA